MKIRLSSLSIFFFYSKFEDVAKEMGKFTALHHGRMACWVSLLYICCWVRPTTLRTRTSVFTFIILIVVSAFIWENQFRDFCLENQWAADLGARLNPGSWFCCSITKFAILSIDEVEKEISKRCFHRFLKTIKRHIHSIIYLIYRIIIFHFFTKQINSKLNKI